jgi:ABC-2 type transport system permease protein
VNFQHVRAIARKEWWHLLRDPRSLALILLMPTMLLFLFGYAIRLDISQVPIGVLQESHDTLSNDIRARFDASQAFAITRNFPDRRALTQDLQSGAVSAALVLPKTLAHDMQNHNAKLQLILDGSDANTARLVRNYANAIVNDYLLQSDQLPGLAQTPPLQIEDRLWFNETRESRYAIIPGVIAVVMAVIGALMTSLTIAREMESGNIVMLRTTPLTRAEFLLGKLLPYFVIGMADLAAAVLTAVYLYDVPLRGSVSALTLISAVFLMVVMLQGALISIAAGNQMLASQIALISTFLPAFLLSGFIFAIENMPVVLQYLTLILPARYYVSLSKLIFLKGVSPLTLWVEVVTLLFMFLLLTRITLARAKKLGLLP